MALDLGVRASGSFTWRGVKVTHPLEVSFSLAFFGGGVLDDDMTR